MRITMAAALAVVCLQAAALANGTLEVRGATAKDAVRLESHDVHAVLKDRIAVVTVEQVFRNRTKNTLEGIYTFPLPDGAGVSDFGMTMGGKMVRGEILERGRARRIYEGIVQRKQDPGLLEQVGKNRFRARVFPIEPAKDVRIRLVYQRLLPGNGGVVELRYPLARERLGADALDRLRIQVEIQSSTEMKSVGSPSHDVEIDFAPKRATVSYAARGAKAQDRDFLLHVTKDPKAVAFDLMSHKAPAERGTFLAVLAPPSRVDETAVLPKDVVYVLDTSGSMEGRKIAQARAALGQAVGRLRTGDRFGLVAFSSAARLFRDKLVEATEPVRKETAFWLKDQTAQGGTALSEGLYRALNLLWAGTETDHDRLKVVVLLTDGLPTIGATDPKELVASVQRWNRAEARFFVFGIGFDQNVALLDRMARTSRGAREYITPDQDIADVLRRFALRIDRPVLSDLKLELGEGIEEVYPKALPDLFAGDPLVVVGRYRKAGPRVVRLHGKLRGKPVTYEYEGSLGEGSGSPHLLRLWARRKVDFLLEEMALRGRDRELVKEVIHLGKKHSLVTPYTAGLVVEDEAGSARRSPRPDRSREGVRGEDGLVVEVEDEVVVDTDFEAPPAEDGLVDKPFTGPSTNGSIGLGGGAGGGAGGLGRRRASGGTSLTPSTEDKGLRWLAGQQDPARGEWPGAAGKLGPAPSCHATLAFLGAGYTDRGSRRENPFARTVRLGLRALMARQREDGRLDGAASARDHALVTLTLCEGWAMTRNPRYRRPATKALAALAWLCRKDKPTDHRTVVRTAMAFRSARLGELPVDEELLKSLRSKLRRSFDPKTGRIGQDVVDTAAGLFALILLGEDPKGSAIVQAAADACIEHFQKTDDADPEFMAFGTLSLYKVGGLRWKKWNRRMIKAVAPFQVASGTLQGSWPPRGDAGRRLGRVGMTALMTTCLQVYYRYDAVSGLRSR